VGGGEVCLQLLSRLEDSVADMTGEQPLHGPTQQGLADPLGAVGADAVGLVDDTRGVIHLYLLLILLVRVLLLAQQDV